MNVTEEVFRGVPEVCLAGRWNGVCTDEDTVNQTAAVVCRQHGCEIGYGQQGSLCSEHTLNVHCTGPETNLTNCDIRDSSICTEESGLCVEVHCATCQSELGIII